MSRPEHLAPPEVFYGGEEAKKYGYNSRMMTIQTAMAERAIQLLCLEPDQQAYVLDVGTGSGLSGEVLTEKGYEWVGVDISPSMLGIALEREVEGDLLCTDMGQGMSFRGGTFDGCISISALQWLCNADQSTHVPQRRLKRFFTSLYHVLVRGARAVFQLYPEGPDQLDMIRHAALTAGFHGGYVIDYPNSTKAKKIFLCVMAGEPESGSKRKPYDPQALTEMRDGDADGDVAIDDAIADELKAGGGRTGIQVDGAAKGGPVRHKRRSANEETRKEWITRKKDRQRRQGKKTAGDSKYSGRSRGPRF